jgi:hypothetical protein
MIHQVATLKVKQKNVTSNAIFSGDLCGVNKTLHAEDTSANAIGKEPLFIAGGE